MAQNKRKKKKKKKSLIGKFFKIVFSILAVYFICLIGFFAYAYFSDNNADNQNILDKVIDKVTPLPERTIGLIACTDEGEGRTDGIMLVSYNSVNKKISLVSIPRDTRVKIPDDMWAVMVENVPRLNGTSRYMKINAVPNYGKERGMEFLEQTIEDMLDINIDYYAHLNFEGFKYIVDSVGGIEFDVPQKMYYSDPSQDLLINLKPGVQLLGGEKSEQLLRFRSYPMGDLQRVKVQQDFMKVFFEKIVSVESILSNPSAYFTTLTQYIDTNFSISDGLKYITEIKKIDITNVETFTIPCTTETINALSYVILDDAEVKEFAYEVFKKPTIKPEDIVYEDSFDKSIKVLNGSFTSGMAKQTKELLQDNGYIIGEMGDSPESKSKETKIYVSKEGEGADLQKFFTNSKIIVNPTKTKEFGYDIIIIFGTEDTLVSNSNDNE